MTPKRNVTPTVDDDLEDLIGAAVDRTTGTELVPLAEISAALRPAADIISATVSTIALVPINRATPAERSALVDLRNQLDRTRADLSTWVDAIDISFRRAALETGATEIVLADGVVSVEAPRGEWVVNVPALRSELKELVAHGLLSEEEFDSIFETVVTEKANNSRLNYFASKRGQELADAIARYRTWKEGNPANAKVRIKRRHIGGQE